MSEKLKNMTYAELPHAYDAWHHMIADFHDIPEIFTGERNGKRNTEVQASLYDAMMTEIMGDRMAEKSRVRNRRSERRNHMAENWEAEKDRRKDMHWSHLEKKSRRDAGSKYGYHWASNAERKICKAEKVARADWEIESAEIELDAEFNFWAQKIEHERLNDWLKYA